MASLREAAVYGSAAMRHRTEIVALAVAHDDSFVVAVSRDEACAWDLSTGELRVRIALWAFEDGEPPRNVAELEDHPSAISFEDATTLVVGTLAGRLVRFAVET